MTSIVTEILGEFIGIHSKIFEEGPGSALEMFKGMQQSQSNTLAQLRGHIMVSRSIGTGVLPKLTERHEKEYLCTGADRRAGDPSS